MSLLVDLERMRTSVQAYDARLEKLRRNLEELAVAGEPAAPAISVAARIDQCQNAPRIWAAVEQKVDHLGVSVFEQETTMLSLLLRALLSPVYATRVQERTWVASPYYVLPDAPLSESSKARFEGHREQTECPIWPVRLIDVLRFIMQHTVCSEKTTKHVAQLDAMLSEAVATCTQHYLCRIAACGHVSAPDGRLSLDANDEEAHGYGCTHSTVCDGQEQAILDAANGIFESIVDQAYYPTACMIVMRALCTGMSIATAANGKVVVMCNRAQAAAALAVLK